MKQFITNLKMFAFMMILLGLIYPILMTLVSLILFNDNANGSLIDQDGKIRGSSLIAQKFKGENYFWPRPSANDYNGLASGGSNLSSTSSKLKDEVERRKANNPEIPSELLYASGSGLDPHITQEGALYQVDRIAKARGIAKGKIEAEIKKYELINVLELNLWLDGLKP